MKSFFRLFSTLLLIQLSYFTSFIQANVNITNSTLGAKITGPSSICINSTKNRVTFTGLNGTPPYSFYYRINNVLQTTVSSGGTSESISIPIPSNLSTDQVFKIEGVADASMVKQVVNEVFTVKISSPDATFNVQSGVLYARNTVTFTPVVQSSKFTYLWSFGDGTTSTEMIPVKKFAKNLTTPSQYYNVKLSITDTAVNCSAVFSRRIAIVQYPSADFNTNNTGDPSLFFDSSKQIFYTCGATKDNPTYLFAVNNGSSTIMSNTSYTINWGDGSEETFDSYTTKTHNYANIGYYDIKVSAYDAVLDTTGVKTYRFFNGYKPVGALVESPTNDCAPYVHKFIPQNCKNNAVGTAYELSIDDGSPIAKYSQETLPDTIYHTFLKSSKNTSNQKFTVKFTISTPCNSYTNTLQIQTFQKPVASFTVTPITVPDSTVCIRKPIDFISTSIGDYAQGSSYGTKFSKKWSIYPSTGWEMITGMTSDLMKAVFTKSGKYTIKLLYYRGSIPTKCTYDSISTTICVVDSVAPKFSCTIDRQCVPATLRATNNTIIRNVCKTPTYYWRIDYNVRDCGTSRRYEYVEGTDSLSANPVIKFINPGNYRLFLSYNSPCGLQTKDTIISLKAPPTVSIDGFSNICVGKSIRPTATILKCTNNNNSLIYAWEFEGGLPAKVNSPIPPDITYPKAGKFPIRLTVTNDCGISAIATDTVLVSDPPFINNVVTSQTICSGNNSLPVEFSSANNLTRFYWTALSRPSISGHTISGNTQTIPAQNISTTSVVADTLTYAVRPEFQGCSGSLFYYTIYVNPAVKISFENQKISCIGKNDGQITATLSGGNPYKTGKPYRLRWEGPNGFLKLDTNKITNLAVGKYTLTVQDNSSCIIQKSDSIIEPEPLTITTDSIRQPDCHNASTGGIFVTPNGGTEPYYYSWKKDNIAIPENTKDITNLSAGFYELNVMDANRCKPIVKTFVISNPLAVTPRLIRKKELRCYTDTITAIEIDVDGGMPFQSKLSRYNFLWKGPRGFVSTKQNLDSIYGGEYNLTVTDSLGCTATLAVSCPIPKETEVSVTSTDITCFGANDGTIKLSLSDKIIDENITWSNGATGRAQTDLAPGIYSITIADSIECKKNIQVNIKDAPVFQVKYNVRQLTKPGVNDGSIELIINSATKPTVNWDDISSNLTRRNNLSAKTYHVKITNLSICYKDTFITIYPIAPITVRDSLIHSLGCFNANTGAIYLFVSGGKPPYTYEWSNGAKTKDITNIPDGIYSVTIKDANSNTVVKENMEVKRPSPLTISKDQRLVFDCATKSLKAVLSVNISGGVLPHRISWSGGVTTGINATTAELFSSGLASVRVTDSIGCYKNEEFDITIPLTSIDKQAIDCNTRTYQFNSIMPILEGSNTTYLWDFDDGTSSKEKNPIHSFPQSTSYNVKLTVNTNDCSNITFNKTVEVDPTPLVTLDRAAKLCVGDSVLLQASGADSYLWFDGTSGASKYIKESGQFYVVGKSKAGCTYKLPFTATYNDLVKYEIRSDRDFVSADNPELQLVTESTPATLYYWDFGDGTTAEGNNQIHKFNITKDGYFDVNLKVVNTNGCVEYATKRVWIKVPNLPNTFTPDGDGHNDVFMKNWKIKVYNRNGITIYDGTDGWDGNYNGKPVPNDTYFYILYYLTESGVKTKEGFVTLLR